MPGIINFRDNMPSFRGSFTIYIFKIFMSSLFKFNIIIIYETLKGMLQNFKIYIQVQY